MSRGPLQSRIAGGGDGEPPPHLCISEADTVPVAHRRVADQRSPGAEREKKPLLRLSASADSTEDLMAFPRPSPGPDDSAAISAR